jgi:aminoglycoside phosphotransferase (APT) family kinase protein
VYEWSAEVTVDAPLVRQLIAGQFPQLDVGSLRPLAEGWDNSVWLLEESWVFRFPRRAVAIAGVRRELAVLPRIAPLLPLPVPTPRFVGRPAEGYPWPFFGAPVVLGREAGDVSLSDAERVGLAEPLAVFLRRLHGAEVDAAARTAVELPGDPMGRADMAVRVRRTDERLRDVERLGLWRAPPSLRSVLDAARLLPAPEARAVVHGDLHFRHLLVDHTASLTGVIDWGDVCRGDPSIDLPLVWCFLPPAGRSVFMSAYGPVTEEQLLRARVLAVFLCAALALYGHHEGMRAVEREALRGLTRAATD